jgi:hypothetical protein
MSLLAAAASWPGVMKSPKRMARPGTKPVSY